MGFSPREECSWRRSGRQFTAERELNDWPSETRRAAVSGHGLVSMALLIFPVMTRNSEHILIQPGAGQKICEPE